ncbi:MAG: protease SohB, partial [Bdellovibrionales bacterium]|nr:protease SohB [Bdellovibrionales bacterium]
MEYLAEFGVFAGRVIILVAGILVVLAAIALLVSRKQQQRQEHLEVLDLGEKLLTYGNLLKMAIFNKKQWKEEQKKQKEEAKNKEKNPLDRPRVFVLSFDGDVRASQVERLRQEISILLQVAGPSDEVLIRVESPGGMVHGYGLAAAQLMRIRKKSIPLTVAVDKVAA